LRSPDAHGFCRSGHYGSRSGSLDPHIQLPVGVGRCSGIPHICI
jgi:hypothetical protein